MNVILVNKDAMIGVIHRLQARISELEDKREFMYIKYCPQEQMPLRSTYIDAEQYVAAAKITLELS